MIRGGLRDLNLSPLDPFRLVSLIDSLTSAWWELLKTCDSSGYMPFKMNA